MKWTPEEETFFRKWASDSQPDSKTVDDFLNANYIVSKGAETAGLYADYQAFCDSRQVEAVNPTAFAVRVMNIYQGRGVERDEVMRDGKRTEIYRGLAFKGGPDEKVVSPQPPVQTDHDFLPDPDRSACPDVLIGGLRSVPEPPKAVPTDDADLRKRVWRMYPDLVHMTPDKILARAERWESLGMMREADLARQWCDYRKKEILTKAEFVCKKAMCPTKVLMGFDDAHAFWMVSVLDKCRGDGIDTIEQLEQLVRELPDGPFAADILRHFDEEHRSKLLTLLAHCGAIQTIEQFQRYVWYCRQDAVKRWNDYVRTT